MAKRFGPTFLIKNRLGVFYFQRRIPEQYRVSVPVLPMFVRLSLHTRDRSLARKHARMIAVMWDQRARQYFRSEEQYHRGMKLLQEYLAAESRTSSFDELSAEFLDNLDDTTDRETDLLNSAANLHTSRALDVGNDPYSKQIEQLTALINSHLSATAPLHQSTRPINNITLTQAFEDFISSQRGGWKVNSGMEQSYRESYFPFLLSIIGDVATSTITKNHMSDVAKIMLVYPANKNKKMEYSYLQTTDFLSIDTPNEDRWKPITLTKYRTQIGTFLKWMKSMDLTAIDLDAPLKSIKVQKTRAVEQKSIFTPEDLKKLFNSNDYVQGQHETASRFWVPLIALYTGARLNEICQLSTNDVHIETNCNRWVFDFNENEDVPFKSLKKTHHARLVPVHKKLIELGFIDYVNTIKGKNSRIFPELNYVGDANKYGNAIQRWFNRTYINKKNCNITTPHTSFHSFRHTVITHLALVHGVSEDDCAGGLGQSPNGGVFKTRYTKYQLFNTYCKYFDLINFDDCYDSKKIRGWKHHRFAKFPKNLPS